MNVYDQVPGGAELLEWFGCMPTFHDAEILSLHLNRDGPSILRLYTWIVFGSVDSHGYLKLEKHAVVAFLLDGLIDLQLEGISDQNVIGGLILRRASDRPERRNFLGGDPHPDDIEIELLPCYGLDGFIRARKVTVMFTPGRPNQF